MSTTRCTSVSTTPVHQSDMHDRPAWRPTPPVRTAMPRHYVDAPEVPPAGRTPTQPRQTPWPYVRPDRQPPHDHPYEPSPCWIADSYLIHGVVAGSTVHPTDVAGMSQWGMPVQPLQQLGHCTLHTCCPLLLLRPFHGIPGTHAHHVVSVPCHVVSHHGRSDPPATGTPRCPPSTAKTHVTGHRTGSYRPPTTATDSAASTSLRTNSTTPGSSAPSSSREPSSARSPSSSTTACSNRPSSTKATASRCRL